MDRGQASIELLGGLPALLALGGVLAQLLAIGYTAVLAGNAAEAGALAIARGGGAQIAAKNALPGWARSGVRVRGAAGAVRVEMRPPALVPWLGSLVRVHATAAVAAPGRVPGVSL
jgi:hypothetical protein